MANHELIAGLAAQIQKQFDTWQLTRAEAEVGMLVLKGLSHTESSALGAFCIFSGGFTTSTAKIENKNNSDSYEMVFRAEHHSNIFFISANCFFRSSA